jgi:glycosyltransferase involved in cell wall biosynthesis
MVTVGLPVFNGADYIREAIDAVLAQTYTDFELLISDNASTDDTAAICREYATRDGRIRFVRQERNLGALGNFEFVLEQARGTLFMWAAADDLISPNWIAHLVSNIRDSDFGVFGQYQYVSELGKDEGAPSTPQHLRRNSQLKTFMLADTCGKCFYMYSLFRRDTLASLSLFAEKPFLGNDQIIIMKLLEHGDLRAIPGAVLKYRLHDTTTSSSESRQRGIYRRALFSVFPATYYRHALAAVPRGKRLLALPLIPVKYVVEQGRSYRNFLGQVARKVERMLRSNAPRRPGPATPR